MPHTRPYTSVVRRICPSPSSRARSLRMEPSPGRCDTPMGGMHIRHSTAMPMPATPSMVITSRQCSWPNTCATPASPAHRPRPKMASISPMASGNNEGDSRRRAIRPAPGKAKAATAPITPRMSSGMTKPSTWANAHAAIASSPAAGASTRPGPRRSISRPAGTCISPYMPKNTAEARVACVTVRCRSARIWPSRAPQAFCTIS